MCSLQGFRLLLGLSLLATQCLAQSNLKSPTTVRVADAICAKCHAEIYNRYLATPMANASGAAIDRPHPTSTVRSIAGVAYTFSYDVEGRKATLRSRLGDSESRIESLDYFLGSGHLGTTYTYADDGFLFESPIAWYAASGSFDLKPGLATLTRPVPALPLQSGCLRCHMSDVQPSDPGTINRYSGLAFLHTGVTCEACHGDASGHIANGDPSHVVNPAKLSTLKRDSVCINCHLEGDSLVTRADRSALNFKPGGSITDMVAYYVYSKRGLTARGVSEVEQFAQSGCKRASGDRMSCTSCHDPHFTPSSVERAAYYRSKCLVCHNEPEFAKSHHPENKDCVSCHMKATGAENVPHVAWTDHRILRVPETARPDEAAAKENTLTPIFPESSSKRDLAMAYYKAMLAGDKTLEPVAWAQLNGVRDALGNDPEALDALGVLTAEHGQVQPAIELFRKVLAMNPDDLTALSNLGTLMVMEGNLDEARRLLNAAFARNQDLPGLALNVARVDCMAADSDAAKKALKAALVYNPGLESLQLLNARLSHCPVTDVR